MPFEIVRNDIVNMSVDVIVNAANHRPVVGVGVDSRIHKQAGSQLLESRKKIGDIPYGEVAITPAYNLKAKYVIHAVSPMWFEGEKDEKQLLKNCYTNSLNAALEMKCESIAFPLLSAGNHGFPDNIAMQIAVNAISNFLMENDMYIYLVVYNNSAFSLSEKLFSSVKSYIDENYVQEEGIKEYGFVEKQTNMSFEEVQKKRSRGRRKQLEEEKYLLEKCEPILQATVMVDSLDEMIKNMDKPFSEYLLELIDKKGLTDPEVYKKANIDRKLFNKIKNTKNYKPSKITALAFAIALELNLDETTDLIRRAGYALSHSSLFDVILEAFIVQGNYDVFRINEVLFSYDQPLLK